jgi:hypothetical protein
MDDAAKIAALNDLARRSLMDCRVVVTQGIQMLGDVATAEILAAVHSFDAFTEDNDPYAEHDFGKITYAGFDVFWKWDYYDLDFSMHSPDPTDTTVTARVLTIMLAEEYCGLKLPAQISLGRKRTSCILSSFGARTSRN